MHAKNGLAAALSLAAASIGHADVLHVDQYGGGQFLTVQEAVDVASPGDTILVEGGDPQPGFVVDGLGLSIVAFGAQRDSVVFETPVSCQNVPAGQLLLLSGIDVEVLGGIPALGLFGEGSIRVQGCSIVGSTRVEGCPDVAFARTTLQADTPDTYSCAWAATNGLLAIDSNVAFFEGEAFGDGTCCLVGPVAFNGMLFDGDGDLFVSGSYLAGRNEGVDCGCNNCGPDAGDGLHVDEFSTAVASLLDCTVAAEGGLPGGVADSFCSCCFGCNGEPGTAVDAPPSATVALLTTDQHRRFSSDSIGRSGEPVLVRFVGAPGDLCILRVGEAGDFQSISTEEGVSLLAAGFQQVVIGSLPPEGSITTTWTAPTLAPGERARPVLLQGVFKTGADESLLRSPAAVTVLADGSCQVFDAPPLRYCDAVANSTGAPARMGMLGSTSVSANDLVLKAWGVPAEHSGIFIYSPDQASLPLGDGILCLGSSTLGFVLRLPATSSGTAGVLTHAFDNSRPPDPAGLVTPGSTWSFSAWYRDVPAGNTGFNFADGLQTSFCP